MRIADYHWQAAIRKGVPGGILTDRETPFQAVPNPRGMWAADPFIMECGEKLYIFAELFSLRRQRGEIGYCVYENGRFTGWTTIIREGYHLSYPHILIDQGAVYLMPETGEASEISVYEMVRFPRRAEKRRILYTGGNMVDTTRLPEGYFLSYRLRTDSAKKKSLALLKYDGEKLIEISEREDTEKSLRPGGAAFSCQNQWVRPAQDGSHGYGSALDFLTLTVNPERGELKERKIGRIEPAAIRIDGIHRRIDGLHTYNSTPNYEVIDVKYKKFTVLGLVEILRQKLKSLFSQKMLP